MKSKHSNELEFTFSGSTAETTFIFKIHHFLYETCSAIKTSFEWKKKISFLCECVKNSIDKIEPVSFAVVNISIGQTISWVGCYFNLKRKSCSSISKSNTRINNREQKIHHRAQFGFYFAKNSRVCQNFFFLSAWRMKETDN